MQYTVYVLLSNNIKIFINVENDNQKIINYSKKIIKKIITIINII